MHQIRQTCILLVANSTPIVDFDSRLNSFRVNRDSKLDLPTPESPINTTKIKTIGKRAYNNIALSGNSQWKYFPNTDFERKQF